MDIIMIYKWGLQEGSMLTGVSSQSSLKRSFNLEIIWYFSPFPLLKRVLFFTMKSRSPQTVIPIGSSRSHGMDPGAGLISRPSFLFVLLTYSLILSISHSLKSFS